MVFFKKLASINFIDGLHLDEKLWANENGFHYPENPFPPARMKDFVEKYFPSRRKKTDKSLWKMEKNPLAEKSVSLTTNKLPLAGILFKNWISPKFNDGFH